MKGKKCEATTGSGKRCANPTGGPQYCHRHRRRPEITTRLTMHLNGGDKYSMRVEEILLDGLVIPGMTMGTGTDGSPEFLLTSKEICWHPPGSHNDPEQEERLDLMTLHEGKAYIDDWILSRAAGAMVMVDG